MAAETKYTESIVIRGTTYAARLTPTRVIVLVPNRTVPQKGAWSRGTETRDVEIQYEDDSSSTYNGGTMAVYGRPSFEIMDDWSPRYDKPGETKDPKKLPRQLGRELAETASPELCERIIAAWNKDDERKAHAKLKSQRDRATSKRDHDINEAQRALLNAAAKGLRNIDKYADDYRRATESSIEDYVADEPLELPKGHDEFGEDDEDAGGEE